MKGVSPTLAHPTNKIKKDLAGPFLLIKTHGGLFPLYLP